ncbi:hypothetical protein GW17_00001111 [Ensete ventricosum]|nr:hypothetical protein GW17_00001111 [Ensete ventricosum]
MAARVAPVVRATLGNQETLAPKVTLVAWPQGLHEQQGFAPTAVWLPQTTRVSWSPGFPMQSRLLGHIGVAQPWPRATRSALGQAAFDQAESTKSCSRLRLQAAFGLGVG